MLQVIQIVGAVLILVPFAWSTLGSLSTSSPWFLWLNLLGGTSLAISAIGNHQWGFVLLESTWTAVALWRIVLPGSIPTE